MSIQEKVFYFAGNICKSNGEYLTKCTLITSILNH